MDPWRTLRDEFEVLDHWLYLDHAALCPPPRRVRDRMVAFLDDTARNGHAHYDVLWSRALASFREQGAWLVNGAPEGVFLVRSTTQGLGLAVGGLAWEPGDNVVLVAGEFPANLRPWTALRRRGVEVRQVAQVDGRIPLAALAEAMDRRTRALSLSFVQYGTGFRMDLEPVGALCRKHDALFVVDGIQGLGAFPLDVTAAGIDLLSADSHKWLMGPEGVGLGYVSERGLSRLETPVEGWMSIERPFDFATALEQPLKRGGARYEEGAYNLVGLHGLLGSLELIRERGPAAIGRRLIALTDGLAERLSDRGWTIHSPRASDGEKSGILVVGREGHAPEALARGLKDHGIIASARGPGLRLSPHAYNDEGDLDRLVAALDVVAPPDRG